MDHLTTAEPDHRAVPPASEFDGRYYAEGFAVFKAPKRNPSSGRISLGFKVCDVSDAVSAEQVAVCLNAAEQVERFEAKILRYQATVRSFRAAMENVCDELEEDFDVIDGSDGQPLPNKAMRLASELKEAIYGPGGF